MSESITLQRWTARSPISGYIVAILSTVFILLVRIALSPLVGDSALFFPFILAVSVSAWYAGLKPGLVATLLGALAAVFLFVPPYYSFAISDPKIAIGLVFYILSGVTISFACNALHIALRRLEKSESQALQHFRRFEREQFEKIQADQALLHAEQQLHIVTDTMSAPVTRCTRDLKYAWVSKPYAQMLQKSPEEIIGRKIEDIIGKEAFDSLSGYFDRVLSGETVRYEQQVALAGVGQRWISAVYKPTLGVDGVPDGWVAVTNDIDELKRSEVELKAADRRKDHFLAVLAHELRNPLAPIRNSLEILKRTDSDSRLFDQAKSTMERQLAHMVRLVDDLLDLSRINSDKLELQKTMVPLDEVVAQAVETVRPLINEAHHDLTVELPQGRVDLYADSVRLAQAFSNLLNNACKFTRPGGTISITAEQEDGHVTVAIRDNGEGIPRELSPKIFDMFTQASRGLDREHSGLGIGLALVKRLVEMHQGQVSVGNNPAGEGSEFRVRLPILSVTQHSVSRTMVASDVQKKPESMKILVVDDNQDTAESFSLLMEMSGNVVATAHDGEEALKVAEQFKPEVVLLDIGLPKLSGYEVAERIRNKSWGRDMILVAITGWGQTEDKERARVSGFNHHLVKPVSADTVLDLVRKDISNRGD